jgi:hypothetical protein
MKLSRNLEIEVAEALFRLIDHSVVLSVQKSVLNQRVHRFDTVTYTLIQN